MPDAMTRDVGRALAGMHLLEVQIPLEEYRQLLLGPAEERVRKGQANAVAEMDGAHPARSSHSRLARSIGYFDPARNALVINHGRETWVYGYKSVPR